MSKAMMGLRIRERVKRRLTRIAREEGVTLSRLMARVLTDYSLDYGREEDQDMTNRTLADRATDAAIELEEIVRDVDSLADELEGIAINEALVESAAKELEQLAESLQDRNLDLWSDDDDDDEDDWEEDDDDGY